VCACLRSGYSSAYRYEYYLLINNARSAKNCRDTGKSRKTSLKASAMILFILALLQKTSPREYRASIQKLSDTNRLPASKEYFRCANKKSRGGNAVRCEGLRNAFRSKSR